MDDNHYRLMIGSLHHSFLSIYFSRIEYYHSDLNAHAQPESTVCTFTLLKVGHIEMVSNLTATFKGFKFIHINHNCKLFTFCTVICVYN